MLLLLLLLLVLLLLLPLLLLCPATHWNRPRASPRADGIGDVIVTTTRALPLSSQSRLQHSPNTTHTHYPLSSRTRTTAICEMPLLVHEIDGSEGEDNPPRAKRIRRVFPRPIAKLHLRGELVRVRSRAIAVVDYFARTLFQK